MAALKDHRELRFFKQDNFVFVFTPIILESFGPKRSYIVTWMTPKSIATIQQMIWGMDHLNPRIHTELHTFIDCPSEVRDSTNPL